MQAGWSAGLRKGCTKGGDEQYTEQVQKGVHEARHVQSHGYHVDKNKDDLDGTIKSRTQAV